jgi:hypothetical protein
MLDERLLDSDGISNVWYGSVHYRQHQDLMPRRAVRNGGRCCTKEGNDSHAAGNGVHQPSKQSECTVA